VNPVHPLIQGRGITVETAVHWNVGYFPGKGSMAGRVVFPLYEDGSLIGYIGRTTLEVTEENPKWKMGKGVVKSFLYGLERCATALPIVITESPWGVLWLHQNGIQACALLGKELSEHQERRLDPFGVIQVAMDNDEAGRAASEKIVERLRPKHKVMRSFLLET
jgi:twinkle protein